MPSTGLLRPARIFAGSALAALTLGLPAAAVARLTYCCQDDGGHQTCGDVLPVQCYNKAYRVLGAKAGVARQVDAPLTSEQRAQREADEQRRLADERVAREQKRRDMALLETYASEREIDDMRDRAVRTQEQALRDLQARKTALLARQKTLAAEAEFYAKKPMPAELRDSIKGVDADLKFVDEQTEVRKKDVEATRTRFDEEKRRFMELKRRGAALPSASTR